MSNPNPPRKNLFAVARAFGCPRGDNDSKAAGRFLHRLSPEAAGVLVSRLVSIAARTRGDYLPDRKDACCLIAALQGGVLGDAEQMRRCEPDTARTLEEISAAIDRHPSEAVTLALSVARAEWYAGLVRKGCGQ